MKKFFIILTLIFTLCINSVYAECTKEGYCINNGSYSSECYSSQLGGVEEAFNNFLGSTAGVPAYSDYLYTLIVRKDIADTDAYAERLIVYKTIEPIYYDSSTEKYILPSKTYYAEVLTIKEDTSDTCVGCSYAVPNWYKSGASLSSLPGDVISSNYDLCDSSGNVVFGGIDLSAGGIEITKPVPDESGYIELDNISEFSIVDDVPVVDITYTYQYSCLFDTSVSNEVFINTSGTLIYNTLLEYVYNVDDGMMHGSGIASVKIPYDTETDVELYLYDDMNQLYSTTVTILVSSDVHGGTGGSLDDDTDSSGSSSSGSSSSGSSSSDTSAVRKFFSEAKGIFTDIGGFFTNFSNFIGSAFSFLPTEINLLFGAGIILVIILRVLGR